MKRCLNEKHKINTQKLNWYVLTLTEICLNEKGINVCQHKIKMVPMPFFLNVHIYIYSLFIERDLYRSELVKFPCVYLCLSIRNFFIFSIRVLPFYSFFCVICTSILSLSMWFLFPFTSLMNKQEEKGVPETWDGTEHS